ncbi:MAG: hypothetical protein KVP17_003951 [Porospora cf. gigantea B]|uniref:uncharacterized protein n=1 Tax=Porospora cf. gigantea B TaxID=2853592 RepID=UPI003571D6E7|nr:MAG: hypothetical protein KVP17_003951 [Porospora cf. gigantea B]
MTCANSVTGRCEQQDVGCDGDCEVLLSDRDASGSECPVNSPSPASVDEREVISVDFCESRGIKRLPKDVDRSAKRARAEEASRWDRLTYEVTQECCTQLRAYHNAIVRALLQTLEARTATAERSMAAFVARQVKINKPKI